MLKRSDFYISSLEIRRLALSVSASTRLEFATRRHAMSCIFLTSAQCGRLCPHSARLQRAAPNCVRHSPSLRCGRLFDDFVSSGSCRPCKLEQCLPILSQLLPCVSQFIVVHHTEFMCSVQLRSHVTLKAEPTMRFFRRRSPWHTIGRPDYLRLRSSESCG